MVHSLTLEDHARITRWLALAGSLNELHRRRHEHQALKTWRKLRFKRPEFR